MRKNLLIIALFGCSISFANETKTKSETILNQTVVSDTPCADAWSIDMLDLQESFCATYDEATVIADRQFEKCLDETYG
jgi:hypothetical protein